MLIVSTSVLTGIAYHWAVFDRLGPLETFLGLGALSYVNFSAILAARGVYRPQNLANYWMQVRETTTVWLFVFFVLSVVAFTYKIGGTYSRGSTLLCCRVGRHHGVALRLCSLHSARPC